jgi:hypothetical protein
MDNMVDNGTNKKCIKVFDNIFYIESKPKMNGEKQIGWDVKITFVSGIKDKEDKVEKYADFVASRTAAEEACFGYMLIEHCRGGIFWKECNFPEGESS